MITVKLCFHNWFICQIFVLATSADVLSKQTQVVRLVSHLETISAKRKVGGYFHKFAVPITLQGGLYTSDKYMSSLPVTGKPFCSKFTKNLSYSAIQIASATH
jgi:hypothetical protein